MLFLEFFKAQKNPSKFLAISNPWLTSIELVDELLYYGISAISLITTGSDRHEGLRACVSLTGPDRFKDLEDRLKVFAENHPKEAGT